MFRQASRLAKSPLRRKTIAFDKVSKMNNKTMMYAQVIRSFGPPEHAFKLEQVPVPEIKENQMLIKVLASSLNPVDCKIRAGLYPAATPDMPAILHSDVVGQVVKLGSDVNRFNIDDEVYGCAGGFRGRQGAIAEYMVVDEELMALKPKTLSSVESAALPLVGITAWIALINKSEIHSGQSVLVHAASGGVGSIAFQLAQWKGADTYVTASDDRKAVFAQQCGASIINYKTTSVQEYVDKYTNGKGFDVVLDTVGGDNLNRSMEAIKESGIVSAIAASSNIDLSPLHRKGGSLHYTFMPNMIMNPEAIEERKHYADILAKIANLADKGIIKPLLGTTVRFSEIAKAHELQEQQSAVGKIALEQDLESFSPKFG